MATAALNHPAPLPKPQPTVTLVLSLREATVLRTVFSNVGGNPYIGPRAATDAVNAALRGAGVDGLVDVEVAGSIHFKG